MTDTQQFIDRLLPATEAAHLVGMGKTLFLEMVAEGRIPHPVRPSAKIVRWRLSELQNWIASLPKAA